jgi:hypothetical protein
MRDLAFEVPFFMYHPVKFRCHETAIAFVMFTCYAVATDRGGEEKTMALLDAPLAIVLT